MRNRLSLFTDQYYNQYFIDSESTMS